MNVAYINPFIVATRHVFDTMVHVPMSLGTPYLRRTKLSSAAVTARVELSGPVTGAVILSLPNKVALALTAGFTNAPCTELSADCLDALGEIASMIVGNAKKDFPSAQVTISTPRVVPPNEIKYSREQPVIVIPCDTEMGDLAIEVSLQTPSPNTGTTPNAPTAAQSAALPNAPASPEGVQIEAHPAA